MQTHAAVKTQRSQFLICQRNQSNTMFPPASGRWLIVVVCGRHLTPIRDELQGNSDAPE
jgi:hypothetical protein